MTSCVDQRRGCDEGPAFRELPVWERGLWQSDLQHQLSHRSGWDVHLVIRRGWGGWAALVGPKDLPKQENLSVNAFVQIMAIPDIVGQGTGGREKEKRTDNEEQSPSEGGAQGLRGTQW